MIIEAVNKALEIANKELDISRHKAHAIFECAALDAAIQMEEAELKVFQESGEDDVLVAMYEEASDGLVGKIKKGITVVVEGLKRFFSALKDKVISIFKKKEVEDSIQQIGLKAKLPFFRTQKVEIKDTEKEEGVIKKYKAKYQALLAKIKSGGKASSEEVKETREGFLKEHAVAVAATTTVTLTAAIALLLKYHKSMDKDMADSETNSTKLLEKLQDIPGVDAEGVDNLIKAANGASDVAKAEGNSIINFVSGILSAIRTKVLKKTDANEKGFKSTLSDDEAAAYGESANDNDNVSLFDTNEFSFMKESGEEKVEQEEQKETKYNSDWIKSVFGED